MDASSPPASSMETFLIFFVQIFFWPKSPLAAPTAAGGGGSASVERFFVSRMRDFFNIIFKQLKIKYLMNGVKYFINYPDFTNPMHLVPACNQGLLVSLKAVIVIRHIFGQLKLRILPLLLSHSVIIFLPLLYGAVKPKLLKLVHPVIKQNMFHRFMAF